MAFDGTKPEYQSEILSQPLRDNFNYLKTQIDVEHNENGTHKDVLKKSGDISTGDFGIKKSVPAIRLIGTEVNAQDIRIVETSGLVKLQKNLGTEASPVWLDFFTVNPSNYLIGTARITEANLDPSTQIPDGRLAQIVTAGKIAESALPATLPKLNIQNTFTNPQIVQGNDAGIYFDNNIDSLYKAEFKKNSDTTASILIKNKSDGSDVAAYSFSADGNLTTKKLTSQTQLVSQVATGTPPLVVNSTSLVNNLYAARAAVADLATLATTSNAVVGGYVKSINGLQGPVVSTSLYSIGSYIIGRPYTTLSYAVDSVVSGSALYCTSSKGVLKAYTSLWGDSVITGFTAESGAVIVGVGTWRCVSPCTESHLVDENNYTFYDLFVGLWVRIS